MQPRVMSYDGGCGDPNCELCLADFRASMEAHRMRSATKLRTGKDPAYLNFIRTQPCIACARLGITQESRSECSHVGDRGLSQKCPDRETIPLCLRHHREGWDSQHRLGKTFWKHWGLDREKLFKELQDRFERDK